MSAFGAEQPILNSPFEEPGEHWQIEEGHAPKRLPEHVEVVAVVEEVQLGHRESTSNSWPAQRTVRRW